MCKHKTCSWIAYNEVSVYAFYVCRDCQTSLKKVKKHTLSGESILYDADSRRLGYLK